MLHKFIYTIMAVLLACTVAIAANDLPRTSGNNISQVPVNEFAPLTAAALTVASVTVDLTNYIQFALMPGTTGSCGMRIMPSSTKSSTYVMGVVSLSTTPSIIKFAKNPTRKFVNFSGCTGGYYWLQ